MKKQLIMLACMLVASIAAFGGTNSKILLQHKGGVKVYDSDQMTQALADAVKGDTIFLPEGTYNGFELTKELTIRGTGEKTAISGDLKIAIEGTPVCSAPLLESLRITGNLNINKAINNLHIRKCFFRYFTVNAAVEDVLIDRCASLYWNSSEAKYHIGDFNLSTFIKSMTVVNSRIYCLNGSYKEASVNFVNCLIRSHKVGNYLNYINCIFGSSYGSSYTIDNATLTNCLYNITSSSDYNSGIKSSCTTVNCYAIDNGQKSFEGITKDELTANKYFGNDGTIVGPFGGNTPFVDDIAPAVPKVSNPSISLDLDNKLLNVSLKVTAE